MDVILAPPETRLLAAAREAGLSVSPGTQMVVHQAASQFQLYTGREAPLEVMERALKEVMERTS